MQIVPERSREQNGVMDAVDRIQINNESVAGFRRGDILLFNSAKSYDYGRDSITQPSSSLNILDNFFKKQEVTFIGYPTPSVAEDNGYAVAPYVSFGLVSNSANQDGA